MCPNCEKKISIKPMAIFIAVLMMVIFSFNASASSSNHKDHSKMKNMKHKGDMNHKGRKSLDANTKNQLLAVLKENEILHNAFFKNKDADINKSAKKLDREIAKVKNSEIAKLLKFSRTKLKEISATSDRESKNQNYHLVSMALIHVINQYDVGNDYNAYSCPMVKKKWVQNSKKLAKVHNPYATQMPHCGSQDTKH